MNTLHVRQDSPRDGQYPIRLTLKRTGQPDMEAEATIEFSLTEQEQEDLRWYLEDYLQHAEVVEAVNVEQVETMMKERGEDLYAKVLATKRDTQALWFSIRNGLADLRVEIAAGVVEAASIPWELMRDPEMDSPISLRVKSFVRVQSNPNISFVPISPAEDGRIRLLYIACRPGGARDVELRAVANRLIQDLGSGRDRFDIKALRPPTFEQLQKELADAKQRGRPYHVVHFDGHGIYADLSVSKLANWAAALSSAALGSRMTGKHGYLLFEHPSEDKMRPVGGQTLGQLLHDSGVPVLVLNACQSATHEASVARKTNKSVHDEVRAIGSLAQAVIDQGIPAVLGMRYSVYVVTAAQFIGQIYAALAKGRGFGQAATEGRKHLQLNPDRWVGLRPRPLQDWFVPVAYEAAPIELLPSSQATPLGKRPELDPVQKNRTLLRYVPEEGFVGRDETILALDRAFDSHRVVLLHAYAGQGKSSTTVEFARWYSLTGGLGDQPLVLFASFENHTELTSLLNQIGQPFSEMLAAQGIHWNAINDPTERRQLVLQLLRLVPILWIWDNVEPVAGFPEGAESQWSIAEQNDLRDFLKQIKLDTASHVKILLTSRRDEHSWLGAIPHRIAMPRMRNSDAAKFALKLGEEKKLHASEVADWQPLLDYCAGNPLTLRILVGQAVKAGLRGRLHIANFVEAIRGGEQKIEDADVQQGREKSLGASLDYGFHHAFKDDELPIIALLHLFQGTIDVDVLCQMSKNDEHALQELKDKNQEQLTCLLERAKDIGILTHIGASWFTIHPALPWFLRKLFAGRYDGQQGRSSAITALRAWVEIMGELGNHYLKQYDQGNRDVLGFLALEEANLLHARRTARQHGWWHLVVSAMQGLQILYEGQGRLEEWSRLVSDATPDYCAPDDSSIPDREHEYLLIMSYRANLAWAHERNLPKGRALEEKLIELLRQQAAPAMALPASVPLNAQQRHHIQSLAAECNTLGVILYEQGSPECVAAFEESIRCSKRLSDSSGEAMTQRELGHAYLEISAVRDLELAESAFQRSLVLRNPRDVLGRARCISSLGDVHRARFHASRKRGEAPETMLKHARAAQSNYHQAIDLCPPDALTSLGPMHNHCGNLYQEVGQIELARDHYEKASQCFEQTSSFYYAGRVRFNMATIYGIAAESESSSTRQRDLLYLAQAYAQSAIRDFQHYGGRAAKDEAMVQRILKKITESLAKLPL